MKTKIALFIGILVLLSGIAFADDINEEAALPEDSAAFENNNEDADIGLNIITIDLSPALYSLINLGIMSSIAPATGFGVGAQYERQINDKMSAAVRFEYGMYDMSDNKRKWQMSCFQTEGHFRLYSNNGIFFSDFLLGYGYVLFDNSRPDLRTIIDAHYFKYGAKIGWRIDFNKPGGFVFEPGIGLYGAFGTKFKETESFDEFPILGDFLSALFDEMNNAWADVLFFSGIRFSLSFGYRF